MIWSTWRQHRTTIVAAVGGILALAVVALVCGALVRKSENPVFYGSGLGCFMGERSAECLAQAALTYLVLATVVLPVVLGALVGVTVFSPDIERGTHVLGLSQSVSRSRWYWTRILVVFVPITIAMTILGAVLEWTRSVGIESNFAYVRQGVWGGYSRLTFPLFQSTSVVAGAYTFLALVVGSCFGLLLRNTLAAMAITVVALAAVMVGFQGGARPHYATATVEAQPLAGASRGVAYVSDDSSGNAWLLSNGHVDAEGNRVDIPFDVCNSFGAEAEWNQRPDETGAQYEARREIIVAEQEREFVECFRAQGADHFEVRYHPDSLFRRFQLIEVALVLALSALLLIPSLWALRRLRP
ncbi:ABC transporter permease [Prescottella agglutinans]|uniref:ABC transporter permease n=1 Tax=Prescottella agglutinans TaxID=1644129 RepID=A0A438BA21_9NOCA|nr:ABC transporter permease [Prescottella agglutinans]RVW07665.1 ABC transporter permease [Prescottella agglutinans]